MLQCPLSLPCKIGLSLKARANCRVIILCFLQKLLKMLLTIVDTVKDTTKPKADLGKFLLGW